MMKQYTVVFEETPRNWSAFVPDLPGCVATGATREEADHNVREAITLHLDGLRAEGQSVPEPGSWTALVEVA